ncbi:MAG: hypothetical protein IID17_10130 [Nitrospinae bacterium]|nr:hypothetical protein [Nitrospinota bacterium]
MANTITFDLSHFTQWGPIITFLHAEMPNLPTSTGALIWYAVNGVRQETPLRLDLMKIAYDFEFETENRVNPHLTQELRQTVAEWKDRHKSDQLPFLFFTKSLDFVTVYDGRSLDGPSKMRFEGPSAWIISFCNEKPRALEQIRLHIEKKSAPTKVEENAVDLAIEDLEGKKILYGERGKYLTLALPHNSHL